MNIKLSAHAYQSYTFLMLNFLNEIIAVWTANILFKIEQFFWYTPPTFFCDSIGILAFRRQNCSELVLNIFHLSDFFTDFDIFLDRKPHLCCKLPGFPDTEVKYQSPLKKIRKTLDISDWSRRSESIDFMANISRSYYWSARETCISVTR